MATIADTYVRQLRQLDATVIPMFPPSDQVTVGSIGTYKGGRYVETSHLRDRLPEPPVEAKRGSELFQTQGAVSLVPLDATVGVAGKQLVKGSLRFGRDDAVVASFHDIVESKVPDKDEFQRYVQGLYQQGELRADRVVVWKVRLATSGAIVVANGKSASVDVSADPSVLGGPLSLSNLGLGVSFSNERNTGYLLSDASLVVSFSAIYLPPDDSVVVEDLSPFADRGVEAKVDDLAVDDVLRALEGS
jgi:hypothetical protein